MKKFLLLTLTLLLGLNLQAQPSRKLAPMKASKSDIILTQPEGELRNFVRTSGGCCDVLYGSAFSCDLKQDGGFVRIVFAPDGKTVYIQNIISRAATGAWVRGTIEDGKILVPYGQIVYWWDAPVNPSTGKTEDPYGLKLAEVTMNGAHTNYSVKTTGNAVFRIEDEGRRWFWRVAVPTSRRRTSLVWDLSIPMPTMVNGVITWITRLSLPRLRISPSLLPKALSQSAIPSPMASMATS